MLVLTGIILVIGISTIALFIGAHDDKEDERYYGYGKQRYPYDDDNND